MTEPNNRHSIGAAVAAANQRARRSMLRNHGGGHAPVNYLELFFDLVYVFAITQLSHFLLHHQTWLGIAEWLILCMALWWAWIYTTWITNWANPDRFPIRLLIMVLMLLSLVMAVALPDAFGELAMLFAAGYVTLQLGRSLTMVAIFAQESRSHARNMVRIAAWFALSALFWFAGAWRGGAEQPVWWLVAVVIEYAGPLCFFRVPWLGRSSVDVWNVSGSHMAERCALFVIIALGEGIVVTGATFAALPWQDGRALALVLAFAGSALLWWIYFDIGAVRGARHISEHAQPGRVARNAFTYLHMPIVLGIITYAVADAIMLEQWHETARLPLLLTQCGGAALFLFGLGLFKRFSNTFGNFPLSHLIGIVAHLLLAGFALIHPVSVLVLAEIEVALLLIVAVWEWVSYDGGWRERFVRLRPSTNEQAGQLDMG